MALIDSRAAFNDSALVMRDALTARRDCFAVLFFLQLHPMTTALLTYVHDRACADVRYGTDGTRDDVLANPTCNLCLERGRVLWHRQQASLSFGSQRGSPAQDESG
jgi:hypothetical protein